ncbi:hypothetical protein [Pseudomonas fluorescens]|uniref:Uncharacterized protein n=1 Tax=Pseudomonas fluorescens TaxID=294 RepID=A0A5E7LKH1_PSEFL|nr:hypothetical protein [Pseudomonas fluorescens]VVP14640.1 hypothetical protein PS880_03496 [Pseudomonas fluorescens]
MNTFNDKSSTHPAFQRTRLGRAISLLLAGVFTFCVTEAEAEENGVELSADGFAPPLFSRCHRCPFVSFDRHARQ